MNKLDLINAETGFTLGISPSIFGSFFQEGGVAGIVILSVVYGLALAWLVTWSTRVHSFAGAMVRAILCAAIVPLLRGGDLAGIYAWFGMAFWPCLILLWRWRRELRLTGSEVRRRAPLRNRESGPPESQPANARRSAPPARRQ